MEGLLSAQRPPERVSGLSMELTKEQQLLALDMHAGRLYLRMLAELRQHEATVTALARQRLELGFEMYGSTMWGWPLETLRRNRYEEYADGLCYLLPEVPLRP